MVLRAKKMALFDFDITICKTTQKWQKKVNIRLCFWQYFQYVIKPNENHQNKSSRFK